MTERNPGYRTKQGGVEKAPEDTFLSISDFRSLSICSHRNCD